MNTQMRRMTRFLLNVTVIGLDALCLMPLGAEAVDLYWDAGGGLSTNWSAVANWDTAAAGGGGNPGIAPGANDTAYFNVSTLNSAQIVLVDSTPLSVQGLVVSNTGNTTLETLLNPILRLGAGGITINAGAGLLQFGSSTQNHRFTFTLTANQTWKNNSANTVTFVNQNSVDNGGFLLTIDGAGSFATGSGAFSGTGGLTKNGSGTFATAAAHAFTGPLTVNGGTLNSSRTGGGFTTTSVTLNGGTLIATTLASAGSASGIGAGSAAADVVFGGGTLSHNVASAASTDRLFTIGNTNGLTATINSSAILAANTLGFTGTGALAFGGSGARTLTLTGSNTGTNTFRPVIGDGDGGATALVKSDLGTWTLSGPNTYTGGTTLSAGTLKLSGSGTIGSGPLTLASGTLDLGGSSQSAGAVSASGGTVANGTLSASSLNVQNGLLQLDFSAASSPRSNIVVLLQGVTLENGGSLSMKGAPGLVSTQSLSSVTIGEGLAQIWNQPSGSTLNVLNLGALSTTLGGGLLITNGAGGVVTATATNDDAGILSGRIVYKDTSWSEANFAARNANGTLGANSNFVAITNVTFTPLTGSNYSIRCAQNKGATLNANGIINSLRITPAGSTTSLALSDHLLTITRGGILFTCDYNWATTIRSGQITVGSGNELTLHHDATSVFSFNAQIIDNGSPVAVTLVGTTYSGAVSPLTLGTNNTYSGGTFINSNTVLTATYPQALGTGFVKLNGGNLTLGAPLTISSNLLGSSGSIIDLGGNTLTVAQGGNSTFAGSIINTGSVVKAGSGVLTLAGANTYRGGTTVEAGTLQVINSSGSGTGTSTVTVKTGATLGGTGSVAGAVTIQNGGKLSPGTPGAAGTLAVSNLVFEAGSTFAVDIGGDTSTDRVLATGAVTLGGALVVKTVSGYVPQAGKEWVIVTGAISSGTFAPVTPGYQVVVGTNSVVLRSVPARSGTTVLLL